MIEQVIVPTDFSDESERALAVAAVLAGRAAAGLVLLTVVTPAERPEVEPRLAVRASEARPGGAGFRIAESVDGVTAALIAELHGGHDELWCVGSHARGAVGELLLGSNSEQLVREAGVPVVVVGPHCSGDAAGSVLAVALDGTEASESVLPAASGLAESLRMTVRLLQVGEPGAVLPADVTEMAYVAATAHKVPAIAPERVDYDVLHGRHPARDFDDYLRSHPEVGLLVMATRGLAGIERLQHPSIAFELAHRASVPVAILHEV